MTQADFTAGTVTVNNGSPSGAVVTASSSVFTPQMAGRWFQVTDGSDGKFYRIASYSNGTTLNLENYYEGIAGGGRSYRIGEVMKLPPGYHDAPVAWALRKYYMKEGEKASAAEQKAYWKEQLRSAQETYGPSTSQLGVKTDAVQERRPTWLDLTKPVTYP